jgi:hypothetical protein
MSTAETGIIVSSPSNKKWYEDEDKQTEFSRAGVGFDAISVKMQELYEIGVLKLFIESEILKSNTGAFERGFKELYNPYSMTVPQRVGKDLLFTSDIEFSESGFAPGSLENDKKKIFLNQNEFTNYLLRLPKPISDTTATPLDEKQDSNAYKYLQVLGDELQDKIAFLCDNFIQGYNRQYKQNANDILRIQKDINDLKRLTGTAGTGITSDDVQKRIADKEKELVQVKNIKIQLEAKRANYKSACAILSNSTRRSQYNASLVAAYPAIKNDASSHSTVMIDWFKLKQNGSDFFKQVCQMFKPMIPKEMMTKRQEILIAIQEVATKLGATFKPIFETFFFTELYTFLRTVTTNLISNLDNLDRDYLRKLNDAMVRQADPMQYSWTNVDAKFKKILSDTTFADYFYKTEFERLQSIAKFMANFDSEILTLFSLFKFEKNLNIFTRNPGDNKNVFERAEQDDDFFKRAENVNMLFQNVFYLENIILKMIAEFRGLVRPLRREQSTVASKINELVKTITNTLIPKLSEYQVKVQRYDYDTLLGTASQSGFVENAFNGKVSFISHFRKNNKFLVSSELIQNSPVTITIPDGNYTLESLSSVVESELRSTCKWTKKNGYEANMLWRCKYDANNFLQLRLYFPYNNIPEIPNISLGKNYTFTIESTTNITAGTKLEISIPEGEYKNVRQVLDAMQKTINDVISKPNEALRPLKSIFTITLETFTGMAGQRILFKLKKQPLSIRPGTRVTPHEDLIITLDNNLSLLFSRQNANLTIQLDNDIDDPSLLNQGIINANSEKRLMQEPNNDLLVLSKTVTIVTRTKIDGEVYDASKIFGVTQTGNNSIQLFPDITVNAIQISDNSNETRNCNRNNRENFDPCIFLSDILVIQNRAFMDFGILNFTSKRINDELEFKAVDLKEIEKTTTSIATRNVFKNEILEKTGIYMNNRLLKPKVPVITPVDILNSILYRYPCIPSPVKRGLVEGSVEFDEFIQERVNVPEFNAVVCLGKGEKDQMPSLTLKNVLKKTLMYDESNGRRNNLLCDLHYAVCGPVYVDMNPSREINRLTIMDQFTLQNNRPNVIRDELVPSMPLPLNPPFTVKGITPFYDYDKECYKYLIYGEYTVETDTGSYTKGCIKYYDPGEKIGPGPRHDSELYDVILTFSFEYDHSLNRNVLVGGKPVPISSIIKKVVWLPSDREYAFDRFIIIGDFQHLRYLDKYGGQNEANTNVDGTIQNYTIWKFAHQFPLPPYYFEHNPIIDNTNVTGRLRISNIFGELINRTRRFDIVIRTDAEGGTLIFIPIDAMNLNQLPNDTDSGGTDVLYKVSCSAVSMNKALTNAYNLFRFYTIMQNKYPNPNPIYPYATNEIVTCAVKINTLFVNPNITDHFLWLGLKEKTKVRDILSCKHINGERLTAVDLKLPIVFKDGDSIENIRVDINDPEIVTVFGKFEATITDPPEVDPEKRRPNKVIRNAMVIYTNLQNDVQNDTIFGTAATYSLGYDNFKGTTVNEDPMFTSFYCVDGLIPASIDKGTMQQNIGILMMKKIEPIETNQVSVVGFHNDKLTAISDMSTVKEGAIPSTFLCYDYNMCADNLKIVYDGLTPTIPPVTQTENGVFNPLTFYAFYLQNVNDGKAMKPIAMNTSLSKGVYSLIHARNPTRLFSSPSNLHVLNTWGIDLSSNQTLFYKRMYEPSKTTSRTLNFNIKTYEKYMNDIVDTILSSAKAYYEEKIKSTFYDYGFIDGKPPILFKRNSDTKRNVAVVVGGGKEENAKQMLFATEAVIEDELANSDKKNRKNIEFKKFIEIRIPDMMMSEEYLSAITLSERKNARIIFVNSIFKYSKQLFAVTTKQNEKLKNNRTGNNVTVIDEYQVVLCSKNETIRDYFSELKTNDDDATLLTLSDDVFDFELPSSSPQLQHDKHVIIVNEWNDKGFIGDYGAYAYSDANALTPNQLMISKTRQIVTEATAVKEATIKSVPKYPNTAFLLNPVFSYHTLDPSKWVGFNSLFEKYSEQGEQGERGIQVGGVPPLYPALYSGYQDPLFMNSQLQALYPQQQQFGMLGPRGYGYGYGYGYGDNDNEVIKMKRKVLESTDVPSKNMRKINFQTMQTDVSFKKIVLWLFDSRENKMLMTKTLIGNNKVVLSLPVQSQQVGSSIRASGYSLLQQLCRRLFNQAEITRRWTLEVSYAYEEDPSSSTVAGKGRTGIFIYSAKSFDLPKPTAELNYVNMQAVLNLTKGAIIIKKGSQRQLNGNDDGEKGNGTQLELNSRDVALIDEVFRVVPLIQGGIISSTSKEFNEIVAGLISKTPHQHLRSSISEKKRKDNVEKNVNFLINLFFPQNSLFFVRGQNKYYIYSAQQNCKIFTIVKQTGYDDDSYLTCLKLFLQSEYDYKQKLSTFRVGCSVKKKLIADNFSSVWDSFWNDLIESEQQASNIKQIENDIENTDADQGEGDVNAPEDEGGDDQSSAPTCLSSALTTCKKMYALHEDWNASNYYPLAYDGVFYNIDSAQQYGFNNEYYYNLDKLAASEEVFYGLKCMKYNGNNENPILYLGGAGYNKSSDLVSTIFELNLKTKKIKPILFSNDDGNFSCIDIIGNKHLLIGGKFGSVIKYIDGRAIDTVTKIPLIIINTETYEVTVLYDDDASRTPPPRIDNPTDQTNVNKICICKNRKVINENEKLSYYEYVGLFGGDIQIETAGVDGPPNIINIGCVIIQIPINESNPRVVARTFCIDTNVEGSSVSGIMRGFFLAPHASGQTINITSIVCDEEEVAKNKTTFYVGGYFNTFGYMDYEKFELAGRLNPDNFIKNGNCNSILKLSITSKYIGTIGTNYQNECTFEPIETNAANIVFNASLALHKDKANSKKYLLAFTALCDSSSVGDDSKVTTTLNIFDSKTRVNAQIAIAIPNSRTRLSDIQKKNYRHQCFTVVEDVQSRKHIAVMNYTVYDGTENVNGYSFTCELNMEAQVPLRVVESKCNDEEIANKNNSITDMCGIKNKNGNQIDLYVAHLNVPKNPINILYPLTVKSNYQQIGSWNMTSVSNVSSQSADESDESKSTSKEIETFFLFVDSIMELSKIYKEYPSTTLFLQNVDYRDKNEKITENDLQQMYDELVSELVSNKSLNDGGFLDDLQPKAIEMEKSCNRVFFKLNQEMLFFWYIMISKSIPFDLPDREDEDNKMLFNKIKSFYDNFIFLLIYAGCINLAQLLCKNYTASVLSNANWPPSDDPFASGGRDPSASDKLNKINVKSNFMNAFTTFGFGDVNINNKFKKMFSGKAQLYDKTFPDIVICSNSETHTGTAYVMRGLNVQLSMLVNSETKQKALQNKIYKSNETFFDENPEFFITVMASDLINTIDQIKFCSFYKFQRVDAKGPFTTNVGSMIDTTIYASVNIDSDVKIDSNKVLDFLKLIIDYFKRLPVSPVIDTGIGGPIERIILGGDFGCNLLHDASVCSQFSKHGMKIYTMPNNSNGFVDAKNVSGNQMFVIDANLTSSSFLQLSVGGGVNENDSIVNVKQRRLKIGQPIQSNHYGDNEKNTNLKLIIVNNKKKTRRRYT